MEFARIDLGKIDATAETIARLQPRLIIHCATLQTWWVRKKLLPPDTVKRLSEVVSGPWLPNHLALSRKLMLAVEARSWQGPVINSGSADISNAVLAKRGLAPAIGLGIIDLVVPVLQMGVAERLGERPNNVRVYAVFHHYHVSHFRTHSSGAPPYFIRLMVGDRDATDQFDLDQLLHQVSVQRFIGLELNAVVAASGVKNALAMLQDSNLLTHSPGPQGLPGGYPVRLSYHGAEVVLPSGLSMKQALAINEAGQRGDGIERIEEDGPVVFTEKAVQVIKEVLDYDLAPLDFDDCDRRSEELTTRFQALVGVD
jgi:hypothetical protein